MVGFDSKGETVAVRTVRVTESSPAPAPRLSIIVGVEDGRYVARSAWCAYAGSTPDEAIGGLVRLFDLSLGVKLRATPAAVVKMASEPRLPDFSALESPASGRRPQIAPVGR